MLITALTAVAAVTSAAVIWDILLSVIPGIISFIAIFLYKNRKTQIRIVRVLLFVLIVLWCYNCFIAFYVLHFVPDIPIAVKFLTSMISAILAWLAVRAIQKDEKLVRSLDRLR
jgi:hypothetical protein